MGRRPVKNNTFVTVKTGSFNDSMTKMSTEGGSYPSWNQKLVIDLPMHERFITVQVQCKTSSGNKCIGFTKIPVSDFMGGYVPWNYMHFLSYRLRDAQWEKKGIINVSVRVLSKVPEQDTYSSSSGGWKAPAGYAEWSSQIGGSRVPRNTTWASQAGVGVPVGRVVRGVPVWCANRA